MTRYYETVSGPYVTGFGIGPGGNAITKERYGDLRNAMKARPVPAEGKDYRLYAATLVWEEYDLPEGDEA